MNQPFLKEYEIRWSDVDANRHLGNFAYINMMSHTRMSMLEEVGFGHKELHLAQVGPIVLRESMHYFKEVLPGTPLRVGLAMKRMSKDHLFFSFEHRFYNHKGKNVAYGDMVGSWISLTERKLSPPPQVLFDALDRIPKSADYRFFRDDEIRLNDIFPVHLE